MNVQKTYFIYGVAFFLSVVLIAAVWQQVWLLLLPVLLLLGLWAFEKPIVFFYVLLAVIPWSVEYQFSNVLGTDFPDEPLMWLNALLALVLLIYAPKRFSKTWLRHPLLWLLLLQLLWAVFTVITSTVPLLSVKWVLAKSWYLLTFVAAPLLLKAMKNG